MDKETLWQYYEYQEQLLEAMSGVDGFDLQAINHALAGICRLFRVCKGVTEFYNSPNHEKIGKGERFICYDSGEEGREVLSRRILTQSMTVAKCSVYMPIGAEPLNEEEYRRVDLIMRTVLSFISRNRLQSIVERLTFYDDSGYKNLRYFMRCIEQLNAKNELGGKTALQFNLRHFSLVNQEIGRSAGDVVIRNYVTMLEDVFGSRGTVCRMGGDNFVAIFDSEFEDQILEILSGVPVLYDVNKGKRIRLSASSGVFEIPEGFHVEMAGEIMDRILSAGQVAKNGGKERIVRFSEKMVISKEKIMRIQNLFPIALKEEEFKVFYQPKINVETGELIGAEALCRWFRDGKIVPPADFIPVLEQNTDICYLDFYMLDHVCRDIRRWLDEGRKVVRVSVNLSRKHMMDVDLLQHILEIIDRYQVPHECIEIELTETTTDVEFRDLKRVVSGLQQAGICTSVDDFGMGYSSLNLIREIPWNVLKVDRSFLPVDDDNAQSTRSIMFKYVVAMAKELGLECIAEGVETKNQVDILRDNHCSFAQGFYFDKPLPLDEFESRLNESSYPVEDLPADQ